jgi:hypothetical protein
MFEDIQESLFGLSIVVIGFKEKVILKFRNNEGCLTKIFCNIRVRQGCLMLPIIFGIYIDKLEDCL